MKKVFSHACTWVVALACACESNAQTGVTKYGTNALANDAANADYNSAFGYYSLGANTSGNRNTGTGANALRFNTTGINNTGIGAAALYQNTTGKYNSGFGAYALFSTTTGFRNTAVGNDAMRLNTTGYDNTASGGSSLYNNTTGNSNEAIGTNSMYSNTSGGGNSALGTTALFANTIGYSNVGVGFVAILNNKSGHDNTAIGAGTLYENITGNWNTAVGSAADVSSSNLTNATAIGYRAIANASNRVRIGNNNVTSIGGQVGWTTFSDGRYKEEIYENVQGLAFINGLRPITYSVNVKALNEYNDTRRRSASPDDKLAERKDNAAKAELDASAEAAGKIIYNGFVAQEVELAAKKVNFEFSGVDKPANDDGLYGLRYDNFISPIVKAVQELSVKNDEKDSLISDLQNRGDKKDSLIIDLQTQVNELKSLITKSLNGTPISSSGYLKQNAPNPFNENTVISYHVPDNAGHAQIRITDVAGRLIKTFNATNGEGQINIRSGELPPGTYSYTLFVNNKTVDTKKMVLLK